jgi:hypothetical protein
LLGEQGEKLGASVRHGFTLPRGRARGQAEGVAKAGW